MQQQLSYTYPPPPPQGRPPLMSNGGYRAPPPHLHYPHHHPPPPPLPHHQILHPHHPHHQQLLYQQPAPPSLQQQQVVASAPFRRPLRPPQQPLQHQSREQSERPLLAGSSQDFETPVLVSPSPTSATTTPTTSAIATTPTTTLSSSSTSSTSSSSSSSSTTATSSGEPNATEAPSPPSASTTGLLLPHGSKIFVGQVPKTYMESSLRPLFERYGPVMDVMVLRDRLTGAHKGCAFVTYEREEDALRVMAELHDKMMLSDAIHPLQIKPAEPGASQPENKLFVGMIPKNVTEDDLRELFSTFGEIEDLTLLTGHDGVSKGCAFIRFLSRSQSQVAIEALNAKHRFPGAQHDLVVRFADTEKQKQQRKIQHQQLQQIQQMQLKQRNYMMGNPISHGMHQQPLSPMSPLAAHAQVPPHHHGVVGSHPLGGAPPGQMPPPPPLSQGYSHPHYPPPPSTYMIPMLDSPQQEGPDGANLFIYHLPSYFSDVDLFSSFATFGNIISSKVFIDKATKQSKCFGFVSFDNPMSAGVAISTMNGYHIAGKRLKVQLKYRREFS